MVMSIITTELTKLALQKLSALSFNDAVKAVESIGLRKTGRAGSVLMPGGLGALGLGIAVGAGIGMLVAPRSGAETRAALRDSLLNKLGGLRSKVAQDMPMVEVVEAREPNGQAQNDTRSSN